LRYVTVSDPREMGRQRRPLRRLDADSGDYVTRMLLA